MEGSANSSNTPSGSISDGHYQVDSVGALIWMSGPPPLGYVPWYVDLQFDSKWVEVWCPPIMYIPVQALVPEPDFTTSVKLELLEIGVSKGHQDGRVNVDYWGLHEYLSKFHELGGAQAQEVSEMLITKLNDLIKQNQPFCEFIINSAPRLLEIETMLQHEINAYKNAFRKFGNKIEIMRIFDEREEHSEFDLHILKIYQEYCTLVYQSRSLWVTTDSVGVTSFIDGQGVKHQVTVKLFPSALCAKKFHISDQCKDALLRKAGFSVDGKNVKYVRWAGEF